MTATSHAAKPVIEVRDLCTRFGASVVHDGVNLEVRDGEIFALAGASGCGKSTLLREIILLQQPQVGARGDLPTMLRY